MGRPKKIVDGVTANNASNGTALSIPQDATYTINKKLAEMLKLSNDFRKVQAKVDECKQELSSKANELEAKMKEIAQIAIAECGNGGVFEVDKKMTFDYGHAIYFKKLPPSVEISDPSDTADDVVARIRAILPERAKELLRTKETVSIDKGAVKKMLAAGVNIPKDWFKIGLGLSTEAEAMAVDLKIGEGQRATFTLKII